MTGLRMVLGGVLGLVLTVLPAAEDSGIVGEGVAGGNIGRTEADDGGTPPTTDFSLPQLGARVLELELPNDSEASLGLYTPAGRLVRILGQCIPMRAGSHRLRWDGMDLFGNPVPAGTPLVLKAIHNRPLRAYYEMAVAAPAVAPWPGHYEIEGTAYRGGWLADHSAPCCATAVGERVLIGASLAECGSNLVAVDQQGRKLWGTKLDGWPGPIRLVADGDTVYALHKDRRVLYRVDPATGEKKQFAAAPQRVHDLTAHAGELYLLTDNPVTRIDHLRGAFGGGAIDYNFSMPQVLDGSAPTEFHISPKAAFGNTFAAGPKDSGNPQNGGRPVMRDGRGYFVLVLRRPVTAGSLFLQGLPGVERVEVYALAEDVDYTEGKHSPLRQGGDGELAGLSLEGLDDTWRRVASVAPDRPLNVVPFSGQVTTSAFYIKFVLPKRDGKFATTAPRVALARFRAERMAPLETEPELHLLGSYDPDGVGEAPGRGWRVRTKYPLSRIYPFHAVLDYGGQVTLDGLALLNNATKKTEVYALRDDYTGDPAEAPDEAWEWIGRKGKAFNKKLGDLSAGINANARCVTFARRVTTRALRLTAFGGVPKGKWGRGSDAKLARTDDVVGLRLLEEPEGQDAPTRRLVVMDVGSGEVKASWDRPGYERIATFGRAPDGTLFSVVDERLCRSELDPDSGELTHVRLSEEPLPGANRMEVSADAVAVSSQERHAVLVFGHTGEARLVLGEKGPREPGPWVPERLHNPTGTALAADGGVWVTNASFLPKRVVHFAADGSFEDEFLGPPMYGGGGRLDPDLKHFFYRGVTWELDFAAGTSRAVALNDRPWSQGTPVNNAHSFGYRGLSRPVYHEGSRYLQGGMTLAQLDSDGSLKPSFALGPAGGAGFLLEKDCWNKHWGRLDLPGKYYCWTDLNDDGDYQIKEVTLFTVAELGLSEKGSGRPFSGAALGPGLAWWGEHIRWQPHRFTAGGTPIYRPEDIRPFNYADLAPHYPRNYTTSGPKSAKPHYFGFKYVTAEGRMIQEGQPYVVEADGSILGGPVAAQPSDYLPPIPGRVLHTSWAFAGGAPTASEIGEIAVVNSMNGYAFAWAADYGMLVGHVFDGSTGGWSGLPLERGTEVTGHRFGWESWHMDFIKAHDGNYYAQAGKSFHAICRIEGLDDYAVLERPFTVETETAEANRELRELIIRRAESSHGYHRPAFTVEKLAERVPEFELDGIIDDWGEKHRMLPIGPENEGIAVAGAVDAAGLYLAFRGRGEVTCTGKEPVDAIQGGFAIEIALGPNQGRGREPVPGDKRILLTKLDGEWQAVVYDYRAGDLGLADYRTFETPVLETRVARIRTLDEGECRFVVKEAAISMDILDLESVGEELTGGLGPGEDQEQAADLSENEWTAEVFLPWATVGSQRTRIDCGVQRPSEDGAGVADRLYWANRKPLHAADLAVVLMPVPGAWGELVRLQKKR